MARHNAKRRQAVKTRGGYHKMTSKTRYLPKGKRPQIHIAAGEDDPDLQLSRT